MTSVSYTLTRKGSVVTFKCGKYIESFDVEMLGWYETYERVKYAAITAGVSLNEDTIEKLMKEVRNG